MNDLIDSLLDRTITSGPSIRPRLPSAYEATGERVERLLSGPGDLEALEVFLETNTSPLAPAAESVSTPKSELPKSQTARLDEVDATPRLPPRAQAASDDVPAEIQVIREIVSNIAQPQLINPRETTFDRQRDQTIDSATTSLLSPPTEPLLKPQVQRPQPAESRSPVSEVVEERDANPRATKQGPRQIKARVFKVSLPDNVQQQNALEATEPVHEEPTVLEISKQKSITQPTVQPRLEPRVDYATRPLLKPERTVEQLVNVTIGRVEVRATPVPPARSRNEKPTTTSLDDYLRPGKSAGRGVGL